MRAGKHVLIEKPLCSNAEEARKIFQVAEETGKIALEAFHWRFHPAAHAVKELIEGGEYGKVTRTNSRMVTPKNSIPPSDIRWQFSLGGGALMDEASRKPSDIRGIVNDPSFVAFRLLRPILSHRRASSPSRNRSRLSRPQRVFGRKTLALTLRWRLSSGSTAYWVTWSIVGFIPISTNPTSLM